MRIKIQLLTQIYLLICLLSGLFYQVITLYLCLVVHELGHIVFIGLFKKKIILLEISPLGGFLYLDKCQNDKNLIELLIYLGGPLFSLILYLFFKTVGVSEILLNSAFYVLILNLLPILPLDGAKILMTMFQYLIPYRLGLKMMTFISIFTGTILIIIFIKNLSYVIVIITFIILNLNLYLSIPEQYFGFLWHKLLHRNHNLPKKMVINPKNLYNSFYKGYNHLFYFNHIFEEEVTVLKRLLKSK